MALYTLLACKINDYNDGEEHNYTQKNPITTQSFQYSHLLCICFLMLILNVFILCLWHRHAMMHEKRHITSVVTTNIAPPAPPM